MADTKTPKKAQPATPATAPKDASGQDAAPTDTGVGATPEPDAAAQEEAYRQAVMAQSRDYFAQQLVDQRNPGPSVPPQASSAPAPEVGSQSGMSDLEKVLFGPTFYPNQPITAGINRATPGEVPLPADVLNNLQALEALASRPDAPPEVQMLLAAIAREMR